MNKKDYSNHAEQTVYTKKVPYPNFDIFSKSSKSKTERKEIDEEEEVAVGMGWRKKLGEGKRTRILR